MTVNTPIDFAEEDSIDDITENLNGIIEKMIIKNPNNWIWSHNRWK
jgi:KDO2-lipid IV(A) lauroyltransferase